MRTMRSSSQTVVDITLALLVLTNSADPTLSTGFSSRLAFFPVVWGKCGGARCFSVSQSLGLGTSSCPSGVMNHYSMNPSSESENPHCILSAEMSAIAATIPPSIDQISFELRPSTIYVLEISYQYQSWGVHISGNQRFTFRDFSTDIRFDSESQRKTSVINWSGKFVLNTSSDPLLNEYGLVPNYILGESVLQCPVTNSSSREMKFLNAVFDLVHDAVVTYGVCHGMLG